MAFENSAGRFMVILLHEIREKYQRRNNNSFENIVQSLFNAKVSVCK